MMKIIVAVIAVLATLSMVAAGEVVQLNADNFDSIVMNPENNVLVSFTATWCGHCVRMKPAFAELAKDAPNGVIVANCDADANRDLMGKFGVRGFPTIKFFSKTDKSGKDYQGARTTEAFKSFLTANA